MGYNRSGSEDISAAMGLDLVRKVLEDDREGTLVPGRGTEVPLERTVPRM